MSSKEIRYFLNGKDMGAAFRDCQFGDGIMPCVSLDEGEQVRLVLDDHSFIFGCPGYYALQGDSARPKQHDPVRQHEAFLIDRRARALYALMMQNGRSCAPLIRGSFAFCCQLGADVASTGVSVTVIPSSAERTYHPTTSSTPNAYTSDAVLGLTGYGSAEVCSEVVALVRYLLSLQSVGKAAESSWSEQCQSALEQALLASPPSPTLFSASSASSPDSAPAVALGSLTPVHSLLGALSVLGGFSEPLRIGGHVLLQSSGQTINPSEASSFIHRGVVVRRAPGAAVADVVMFAHPDAAEQCRVEDLLPVPEIPVDFSKVRLTSAGFAVLAYLISHQGALSAASPSTATPTPAASAAVTSVSAWLTSLVEFASQNTVHRRPRRALVAPVDKTPVSAAASPKLKAGGKPDQSKDKATESKAGSGKEKEQKTPIASADGKGSGGGVEYTTATARDAARAYREPDLDILGLSLEQLPSALLDDSLLAELRWRSVAVIDALLSSPASSGSGGSTGLPSSAPVPNRQSSLDGAPLQRTQSNSSSASTTDGSVSAGNKSSKAVPAITENLATLGHLLVAHARSCPLGSKLEIVRRQCDALWQRLWNVRHYKHTALAPAPFAKVQAGGLDMRSYADPIVGPEVDKLKFVYGSSTFHEEKQKEVQEDRMLLYWERYIIPRVQNHVRRNLKDYEMLDFFEQLRQALRQRNMARALEIIYTLCDNKLPQFVSLPAADRDWSVLMTEEAGIGDFVRVLPICQQQRHELWDDITMSHLVGSVGRVKAVRFQSDTVLLQFMNDYSGVVEEYWLPAHSLKKVTLDSTEASVASVDTLRTVSEVARNLRDRATYLSQLIARRAIFSLCSQPPAASSIEAAPADATGAAASPTGSSASVAFMAQLHKEKGFDHVLDVIYLALSEGIEVGDLSALGEPNAFGAGSGGLVAALERNFADYLNSTHLRASDGKPGAASKSLMSQFLRQFQKLLNTSCHFTDESTLVYDLTSLPGHGGAADNHFVIGASNPDAPPQPQQQLRGKAKCVYVSGASALVLLFSQDTSLPSNAFAQTSTTLSVYADEGCSQLVNSYSSGQEPLVPAVVLGERCFVHISSQDRVPCKVCAVPLHPQLGLAFWTVDFLLRHVHEWQADGVALCFELCSLILEHYNLESMRPSPLKQAILRLISKLLTQVSQFVVAAGQLQRQHQDAQSATPLPSASSAAVPTEPPRLGRAVSGSALSLDDRALKCLGTLKRLHNDLSALYTDEVSSGLFSSFLQQLMDVTVASDNLLPPADRMVREFKFDSLQGVGAAPAAKPAAVEVKAAAPAAPVVEAPSAWSCPACTFENDMSVPVCEICQTPRPRIEKKKVAPALADGAAGSAAAVVDCSKAFHDMLALLSSIRYLNREADIEQWPAVEELMRTGESFALNRALKLLQYVLIYIDERMLIFCFMQ